MRKNLSLKYLFQKNKYLLVISLIVALLIIAVSSSIVVVGKRISRIEMERIEKDLSNITSTQVEATNAYLSTFVSMVVTRGDVILQQSGGAPFSTASASEQGPNGEKQGTYNCVPKGAVKNLLGNFETEIANYILIDKNGYYQDGFFPSPNEGVPLAKRVTDTDYFKEIKNNGKDIITFIDDTDVHTLKIAKALKTTDGTFVGVLVGTLRSRLFAAEIQKINYKLPTSAIIMNESYGIVTETEKQDFSALVTKIQARGINSLDEPGRLDDGEKEYYICIKNLNITTTLPGKGWYMVVTLDRNEVMRYTKTYSDTYNVVIAIIVVLAFIAMSGISLILHRMRKDKDDEMYKYRIAMESFNKLTFEYNEKSDLIYFSAPAKKMLGLPEAEYDFHSLIRKGYISHYEANNIRTQMKVLSETGNVSFNVFAEKLNKHLHVDITSIKSEKLRSNYIMGIIEDITELIERQNALVKKAQTDWLTKLLNRETIMQSVENELMQSPKNRHSLYLIDIDGFKQINDTYGHYIGDLLLQKIARTLISALDSHDASIARLGGDEFCVFVRNLSTAQKVDNIANFICDRLSTITISNDINYFISCSVGAAIYPKHGQTFDELYQCADNALYKSKEVIGPCYTIYDSLGAETRKNTHVSEVRETPPVVEDNFSLMVNEKSSEGFNKLKEILRSAMDNKEFILYKQPKLDLRNPEHLSAEILTRWQSPVYGFIMPNKFIPLLEKTKMISDFDLYVLEASMAEARASLDAGRPMVSLSVNQSLQCITSPYYLKIVSGLKQTYNLPDNLITIELTERGLFLGLRTIVKVVKSLHLLGFRISIDDFGSGYTTLSVLKDLEIDEIKVDKVFVDTIEAHDRSRIILNQILSMAKDLNIESVVEGVETKYQFDYLKTTPCTSIQGFYIGKAMSNEDFMKKFIEKYRLTD